ncbi:MAG: ParB N-terminal domain-containing protein [Candidatus Latescibacterota bacterium]|nr:MAG: ParB N-terminal domain-containing protein [Candidatus Latescibacterota bacterium]
MRERLVTIEAASLVQDMDYYPRTDIDTTRIGYLVESIAAGVNLPPVIADEKTKIVVDGYHRIRAAMRFEGEGAKIKVILRSYPNKKELFLDVARLNSSHGLMLNRADRVRCSLIAKRLGIPDGEIAKALNMRRESFLDLVKTRTAKHARTRAPVVLKSTVKHYAGKALSAKQVAINDKLGGMRATFYVNQVILLIEGDFIDMGNEELLERLKVLKGLLRKF